MANVVIAQRLDGLPEQEHSPLNDASRDVPGVTDPQEEDEA